MRGNFSVTKEEIVLKLADGWSVGKIADCWQWNVRTMEAKIARMRKECFAVNNTHMVANYLRNKLIK